MSVRFSVNIPLYNGEKYIGECIDSILSQSFTDFEVNIVDDGSTDGSCEICRKYNDSRINYYRKENEGPLLTRVYAVGKAHGEYSLFVDCDDYVDSDYLEKINEIIEKENCDMIACSFNLIYPNGTQKAVLPWDEVKVFSGKDKGEFCYYFFVNSGLNSMCTKVIRTDLLKNDDTDFHKYGYLCNGEDFLQSLAPVFDSEKIVFLPHGFYNYRMNQSSVTHSKNFGRYKDILLIREIAYDKFRNSEFYGEEAERGIFNSFMNSIILRIKEIATCDIDFRSKLNAYNEIVNNNFYKKASDSFDSASLDRRNRLIYKLFKMRGYRLITLMLLIKG